MIVVNCNTCGKSVKIAPSRFSGRENFFCNKKCESASRKNKETNCICKICGKPFYIKPFRLIKVKNPCCSRECSSELRKITMLGDKNHQFGLKGDLNSSFKNDWKISVYGYILVRDVNHPFKNCDDFVFFHRVVLEEYLRNCFPDNENLISIENNNTRYLNPDVIVHHKNGNKLDNRIENLETMNLGDHTAMHTKEREVYSPIGKKFTSGKNNLTKKNYFDAGLDICSSEELVIKSNDSCLISTGLYLEIPDGFVGLIWSRSGLSVKNKVEVGAGCIDSSYRGEVKVHLYNFGSEDFKISSGDRIAQLLTVPINLNFYEDTDYKSLTKTNRGDGGFGSTGSSDGK